MEITGNGDKPSTFIRFTLPVAMCLPDSPGARSRPHWLRFYSDKHLNRVYFDIRSLGSERSLGRSVSASYSARGMVMDAGRLPCATLR
jgi:hypothetical protein